MIPHPPTPAHCLPCLLPPACPQSIGLGSTMVVAKVESRRGLFAMKDILAVADAVCLSRGNLGLDCLPEKMASLQKAVVQVGGQRGGQAGLLVGSGAGGQRGRQAGLLAPPLLGSARAA